MGPARVGWSTWRRTGKFAAMPAVPCAIDDAGRRDGAHAILDATLAARGPAAEIASGSLVALGARVGWAAGW